MNLETGLLVAILVLVVLSLFARGGGDATARWRSIERKLDLILANLGIDPNQGLDRQISDLVRSGQKIEAIKLYREQTGVGLKEAKDYVERL
jgi:Ribosomal protein L7/L12 C-terminal domain